MKSKFMAPEKPGKLREFFLLLWHAGFHGEGVHPPLKQWSSLVNKVAHSISSSVDVPAVYGIMRK